MEVNNQLRRAIVSSGLTHYRIGTDTGVNISTIDRFVERETPMMSSTFGVLCDYFGLELSPKMPRKKAATKAKRGAKKK